MVLLLVIVVLILLVGVLFAFIGSSKQTRQSDNDDPIYTLSFDSQNYYRPIRSLRNAISEILSSSNDPAVRAMNSTAMSELKATHDRVILALQTRDQLRKAIESHVSAQSEADRLLKLREQAESAQEKLSFTKAYDAKQNELAEYQKAKDLIKDIENEIELTKATLSELKTKLAVTGATSNASERAEDLRTTLGSLETIQSSVDEARTILHS